MVPSLSLLTSWMDFVVTTNYGALWQKHVAWAKPNGAQLKQYITGHYASIMILLSLLLTASINVFFSSSHELVEMRTLLLGGGNHDNSEAASQPHSVWKQIKFWTGLLILLDIFVTLLGLVTTFTLWSMIAAISDANAHCVLRSSLGQYAISLPPRLVVTSLYIFLTWTLLFVVELVLCPLSLVLVTAVIVFGFVAVIVPLSVLGRLVLHTGAMAQRPILSPHLETQLLPTGLYSSLLLRATHRQRRNPADVTRQYRPTMMTATTTTSTTNTTTATIATDTTNTTTAARARSTTTALANGSTLDDTDKSFNDLKDSQDETKIGPSDSLSSHQKKNHPDEPGEHDPHPDQQQQRHDLHVRRPSEFPLPHASILNAAITGSELSHLLESSLLRHASVSSSPTMDSQNLTHQEDHHTAHEIKSTNAFSQSTHLQNNNNNHHRNEELQQSSSSSATAAFMEDFGTLQGRPPRSTAARHHRRASSAALLLHEWTEDVDVRDLYGAAMPANLLVDDETSNGNEGGGAGDGPPDLALGTRFTDSSLTRSLQQDNSPTSHSNDNPSRSGNPGELNRPRLVRESFRWWGNASLGQLSEDEIVQPPNSLGEDDSMSEPLLAAAKSERKGNFPSTSRGDDRDQDNSSLQGERLV